MLSGATRASRWAASTTKPSAARRRSASRSGVTLNPMREASSSWLIGSPAGELERVAAEVGVELAPRPAARQLAVAAAEHGATA